MWKFTLLPVQEGFRSVTMLRAPCVCVWMFMWQLKSGFLPLLRVDWTTFSRRVTARRGRVSAKSQVSTNHNSRNMWSLIVRRAICQHILQAHLLCNRFSLTVIRLGLEDSFFGGGAKQGQFYPPPSCFKKK